MAACVAACVLATTAHGFQSPAVAGTAMQFVGDATSRIFVPATAGAMELPEFLLSPASDLTLLGTAANGACKSRDGRWEVTQPDVEWFGMKVSPTFVEEIRRPPPGSGAPLLISVLDADIRVPAKLQELMDNAAVDFTFETSNALTWAAADDAGGASAADGSAAAGWTLDAALSLTLTIEASGKLILPRSIFEGIGSRLVRGTCEGRVDNFLRGVNEGYQLAAAESSGSV